MKLFINTGGIGKRLHPLTKDLPKPMVKICGKPVLHHLVDWAKIQGINEIVMMNGFKAEKIIEYFRDGSHLGIKINHSNEPYPLGSGGPIKFAEKHINGPFIYISGDLICDVNLNKMIRFHESKNSDLTAFVHKSSHPEDSDILQIDNNGRVIRFISKHENHKGFGDLSNAGLCIITPKILDLMDKKIFNFENYIFPKVILSGMKMYSYYSEEFIHDMGTFERLKKCENFLETKLR